LWAAVPAKYYLEPLLDLGTAVLVSPRRAGADVGLLPPRPLEEPACVRLDSSAWVRMQFKAAGFPELGLRTPRQRRDCPLCRFGRCVANGAEAV
jgi:hypothetical protein